MERAKSGVVESPRTSSPLAFSVSRTSRPFSAVRAAAPKPTFTMPCASSSSLVTMCSSLDTARGSRAALVPLYPLRAD